MPEIEPMTDEELEAKQELLEQKQIAYVPLLNEWQTLNREAAAKNRLYLVKRPIAEALKSQIDSLKAEIDAEIVRRATA